MIATFINAWKIADLRKKILFTALIVLIFRIGAAIPIPFTNITEGIVDPTAETFMNYLSMMTGDAFNYGTIFAMSVTPYINSSIIIQLLTVAIPYLEKLSKEGEEGRKKIATITRYTTIALALLQTLAGGFTDDHSDPPDRQTTLTFQTTGSMTPLHLAAQLWNLFMEFWKRVLRF